MTSADRVDQIVLLAKTLWFLPPPARVKIAGGLYDLGVRVHPELASKELLADGPPGLGNHLRQQLVNVNSSEKLRDFLREKNPELAAEIDAATTPGMKQALLDRIAADHPGLIGHARRWLAATPAEQLG